jgi:UDP-2,3-diacylglucosamine pyrophosphatase LpxH
MKIIANHGFMVISDGHSSHMDGLPEGDRLAAAKAKALGIPLIKAGDSFDLILYGHKNFHGAPCVQETIAEAEHLPVYVLAGNHEGRIEWMRKLFKGSKVHVCKTLDINVNGTKYHIEHGDRFASDWHHFGFLFRAVAFFMLRFAPKLWLRLTRKWQPGAMKPPTGTESGEYNRLVRHIWQNAWDDAIKHKRTNIIGHTHTAHDGGREMDDGDSRDGSAVYVKPDGTAEVIFFGGKVE